MIWTQILWTQEVPLQKFTFKLAKEEQLRKPVVKRWKLNKSWNKLNVSSHHTDSLTHSFQHVFYFLFHVMSN